MLHGWPRAASMALMVSVPSQVRRICNACVMRDHSMCTGRIALGRLTRVSVGTRGRAVHSRIVHAAGAAYLAASAAEEHRTQPEQRGAHANGENQPSVTALRTAEGDLLGMVRIVIQLHLLSDRITRGEIEHRQVGLNRYLGMVAATADRVTDNDARRLVVVIRRRRADGARDGEPAADMAGRRQHPPAPHCHGKTRKSKDAKYDDVGVHRTKTNTKRTK